MSQAIELDYTPDDVWLASGPPLTDTLGRCELEYTAAMLVRVHQIIGAGWEPFGVGKWETIIRAQYDARVEPVFGWIRNPFLRLDFQGLIDAGFATREERADAGFVIQLTPLAFERIRKWVRRAGVNAG